MRSNNFNNESYDDMSYEDTLYMEEEKVDEYEGFTIDDDEDDIVDDQEDLDDDIDDQDPEEEEEANDDWAVHGLNKTYEGDFDLLQAQTLYFTLKEDASIDYASQREAIKYASFFAKKNNNDAKNFIVFVIQNSEDKDILDMAKTAFFLFFRNYVRHEVENFYNRQPISDEERMKRSPEAINECFVYIYDKIGNFDPNKGMITTFFSSRILRGVVLDYESKRKGHGSKQTMKTDILVAKACKQIIEEDHEEPTLWRIADKTGKKTEAILSSLARIKAEANISSINDENGRSVLLHKKQKTFLSPEEHAERVNNVEGLIKKLNNLPELERDLFLAVHGLKIVDNEILDCEPISCPALAELYGMKINEVKHAINVAQRKLKNKISTESGKKMDDHDRLLSGRAMTFASEEQDDVVEEAYEGLIGIY